MSPPTMPFHIIVLAAGGGSRMKSAKPKVLQQLAGKSMLAHVLATASALNPAQIHVVYGHLGTQVRAETNDPTLNWVEQTVQAGTGDAVKRAMNHIPDGVRVLVLYGDSPALLPETLAQLLQSPRPNCVLVSAVPQPAGLGRVKLDGQNCVLAIIEAKDATAAELAINIVNTGVLAAQSSQLRAWLAQLTPNNQQREYYLTQIFEFAARDAQPAHAVFTQDAFEGFGANDAWELAQLERYLQLREVRRLCQQFGLRVADPARVDVRCTLLELGPDVELDVNVILSGRVKLGAGVKIGAFSRVHNVELAAGTEILSHCDLDGVVSNGACRIGPFARLRPGTTLAEGAHIGNFVETKKANFGTSSKANHLSYLGDVDVGAQVNIGAGTITCNYDGVNKFRTKIEDGAFIGSNSSLIAPLTIGANATIGAGSTITKDAPPDKLTLTRGAQTTINSWRRPAKR
jgi:bifunctional UDP-N-acetylglucosamine pyrophosphorylase / glucosamine-1-phosphate N-acetyltransferase